MYTQCPKCSVSFRVTAEVLRQAAGKVRCGGCSIAFNALDYLSEQKPAAPVVAELEPQLPELTPEPPAELEAGTPPESISAAQSAALLKTLDQLAGSDIRIEDTGVEWRVLDEDATGEDNAKADLQPAGTEVAEPVGEPADNAHPTAETGSLRFFIDDDETDVDQEVGETQTPVDEILTDSPTSVESAELFSDEATGRHEIVVDAFLDDSSETPLDESLALDIGTPNLEPETRDAFEEMRFDDNTPLPDDFDLPDTPYAPPLEEPEPEPQPVVEVEPPQTDFALSEPDEWEDLLGEFDELKADLQQSVESLEAEISGISAVAPAETVTKDTDEASADGDLTADNDNSPAGTAAADEAVEEPSDEIYDQADYDEPPDMDTQFALQAEEMGIDISGAHAALGDEAPAAEPETAAPKAVDDTSIDDDLIAAAFENEAAERNRRHDNLPANIEDAEESTDAVAEAADLETNVGDAIALEAAQSEDAALQATDAWDGDEDIDAVLAGKLLTAAPETRPEAAAESPAAHVDESDTSAAEIGDEPAALELEAAAPDTGDEAAGGSATEPEISGPQETLTEDADQIGNSGDIDAAAESTDHSDGILDADELAALDASIESSLAEPLETTRTEFDPADLEALEASFEREAAAELDEAIAPVETAPAGVAETGTGTGTDDSSGEHFVPEMTEEEMTINRMIDQDLLRMAVEDEDGFTSTIVQKQPDKAVEKEIAELQTPSQADGRSPPMVETIIMEGEFVESALDKEKRIALAAATSGDARADVPPELAAVRGGRRSSDPASYRVIAGVVLLVLVLLAQVLHQSREALATVPVINKAIGPIYRLLGQPLTPEWDISGWRFEATKGSTDENDELLTIYSRIGNTADSALPYPLLHVSLTDRFEEIIGSRVLEPGEYLTGNADPRRPVPSGNTFNAVISLATAAPQATGFKLNVCYRQANDQLRCAIEDFK